MDMALWSMRDTHTYRKISAIHALKMSWLLLTHSEPLVYYVPIESVACLGFIISYTYLTLSLTDKKKQKKIKELSKYILPCSRVTIKELIYKQICNDIKTDIQWW